MLSLNVHYKLKCKISPPSNNALIFLNSVYSILQNNLLMLTLLLISLKRKSVMSKNKRMKMFKGLSMTLKHKRQNYKKICLIRKTFTDQLLVVISPQPSPSLILKSQKSSRASNKDGLKMMSELLTWLWYHNILYNISFLFTKSVYQQWDCQTLKYYQDNFHVKTY